MQASFSQSEEVFYRSHITNIILIVNSEQRNGPNPLSLYSVIVSGAIKLWISSPVFFSPCIDIVLIFFHILVLREHWNLLESRIPLKSVLGGMGIVALSISSHEQT